MNSANTLILLGSLLLAAVVQGMSGLGFSLVAAPVVSQLIPGSQSIGLVNLLALIQNLWQIFREKGSIAWNKVKSLGLGLTFGVLAGLALVLWLPEEIRPIVVALSSIASLIALLKWRPNTGARAGLTAGTWGGAINTYAGVGGPPIAAYLIRQGLDHTQYVRTLQVMFAGLNLVSLPVLGLPRLEWWLIPAAIIVIVIGSSAGIAARKRVAQGTAIRLSEAAIAVVSLAAATRAILAIVLT